MRSFALHFITLHYSTLHCITLHEITWHEITLLTCIIQTHTCTKTGFYKYTWYIETCEYIILSKKQILITNNHNYSIYVHTDIGAHIHVLARQTTNSIMIWLSEMLGQSALPG